MTGWCAPWQALRLSKDGPIHLHPQSSMLAIYALCGCNLIPPVVTGSLRNQYCQTDCSWQQGGFLLTELCITNIGCWSIVSCCILRCPSTKVLDGAVTSGMCFPCVDTYQYDSDSIVFSAQLTKPFAMLKINEGVVTEIASKRQLPKQLS